LHEAKVIKNKVTKTGNIMQFGFMKRPVSKQCPYADPGSVTCGKSLLTGIFRDERADEGEKNKFFCRAKISNIRQGKG
jgi:hypothetical protein